MDLSLPPEALSGGERKIPKHTQSLKLSYRKVWAGFSWLPGKPEILYFSRLSTLSSVTTAPHCFSYPLAWRISEVSGNRLTETLSGHLINPFFASRQSLQRVLLQSNFSSGLQDLGEMRPCAAQGHGLLNMESPSPSGHVWDLLTHHPERCPHSGHTTWCIWTGDTRPPVLGRHRPLYSSFPQPVMF